MTSQTWAQIPGYPRFFCNRDRSRVGVEVKKRGGLAQQPTSGCFWLKNDSGKIDRLLPDDVYSAAIYGTKLIPQD